MSDQQIVLQEEINDLVITAYKNNANDKELIIALDGAIDTYNSQAFEAALNKLLELGHIHLVFSCNKLSYISSMGIGVFLNLLTTVKKRTGSIVFTEMQELVVKVFENLGFSIFFEFKERLNDGHKP
ncbi:MAG: anti-sigma factor antagonist [Spirochaetaceae bacterium]|nr:MAG: anti-sigma factor antagonist [Spirochaetaceae bacterium]